MKTLSHAERSSVTTTPFEARVPAERTYRHLRVMVLCDAAAGRNGVGSYYVDVASQLRLRGVSIELVLPDSHGSNDFCYSGVPLPGDKTQRLALPRCHRVYSALVTFRPHVIIVPTPGPVGLLGLFLATRLNIPIIAAFHTHYEALTELYWQRSMQRPLGLLCRHFLECCNKLLFRRAALVLANSPETALQAKAIGAGDVAIMGTSVSQSFLDRDPVPLREFYSDDKPRVVFAGRLAKEKNVHALIDLADHCPALQVVIAGDGPEREAVCRASRRLENLQYLGWVRREALSDVLDSADVFVLPSAVESFGTVALESLARARPVLVSSGCGIAEWGDFESALFVINAGETLSAAVNRVLSTPLKERVRRVQEGRLAANSLNNWNASSWLQRIDSLNQNNSVLNTQRVQLARQTSINR